MTRASLKSRPLPPLAKFRGRDFVTDQAYTREELLELMQLAMVLKDLHRELHVTPFLPGRHLGMIFEDPSTRTRVSFETGMTELGGHAVYLRPGEMHLPAARASPIRRECSRASSKPSRHVLRRLPL